jgi:hypothetical protein
VLITFSKYLVIYSLYVRKFKTELRQLVARLSSRLLNSSPGAVPARDLWVTVALEQASLSVSVFTCS